MKWSVLFILFLAQVPVSSIRAEEPVASLSDADKLYGLALIWQEVNYNFVFFDQVPELDWDSTFRAFIPQVLATESVFDYYRTLQRFVALLHDGHTSVTLPQHYFDSLERPKIGLKNITKRVYISNVDTSLVQRIPIGSEVLAVDGIPTREYLEQRVFPYYSSSTDHHRWDFCVLRMLMGWRDTEVAITFRTLDGHTDSITLTRNREGLQWHPPIEYDTDSLGFRWLEDSIAYVSLWSFGDQQMVDVFRSNLPRLRQANSVVLDLRDNGGGSTGIGAQILAYFTKDTLIGSTWRTREHRGAHKAWGKFSEDSPNRPYFEGNAWYTGTVYKHPPAESDYIGVPTAVLIGPWTASAAEDFLVMCDRVPTITLIGRPTNGSTGQPIVFDLPGGGWGRVCAKRDTYPDGRDFVGVGVQPDILVKPTVEDMLADRDATLERAVDYLRNGE